MASISNQSGGRRLIQFFNPAGQRKTIRLGKVSAKEAEDVRRNVEALNTAAKFGGAPDPDTAAWLRRITDTIAAKLALVGLIPERQAATLGAFIEGYIAKRKDVKPGTLLTWENVRRNLVEYFGADKPLHAITAGCADEFRLWLVTHEKLADNTVRRRCGMARQFFRAAVRKQLIEANPFDGLAATMRPNPDKFHFVSRADAQKILAACPDAQWRLLFALSRYGGLRCPSEHPGLRWGDVGLAEGRMTVRSPKTEHHPGGASRVVPIFPELRPYLEAVFNEAADGSVYVITRYRDTTVNLRTQLRRIIANAKLTPWPKLWQNLRSTRETELAETFPMHVVCAWIGNSEPVAAKHYLQVTDEHFARASASPAGEAAQVQRAAESAAAGGASERTQTNTPPAGAMKNADVRGSALVCAMGDGPG